MYHFIISKLDLVFDIISIMRRNREKERRKTELLITYGVLDN